jgi:hypothetical protein
VKERDYAGYNKHDGLLSPVLSRLAGWSRLTRLVAIQSVMRSPWNIRPLLGVPKTKNPKGIGLFAQTLLEHYETTGRAESLNEALRLLDWLLENHRHDRTGISWGYQYPWQDVGFFAPAGFPNRVVTCWIGFAFHKAWEVTGSGRYLETCEEICRFLLCSPRRIVDTSDELCLSYVPDASVNWAVMDVSALVGKMLALTATALVKDNLKSEAKRCIRYVANRQTGYGGWFYTDPPSDSHIRHDNYHTGIILDCIHDYAAATKDTEFDTHYEQGLRYYAGELFLTDGAPKWMNDRVYPHDIHGAAQGIIAFMKPRAIDLGYKPMAALVLEWTMTNMYNRMSGEFWYQQSWWGTKRLSLMRWCNGWMALALCRAPAM